MKKLFLYGLSVILIVFLSGCQRTPNMSELLQYQEAEWQMELRIKEGEESFSVLAEKTADGISLKFREKERKDVGYFIDGEKNLSMIYGDFRIALAENEHLPCREWFSCLDLSAGESIWHIRKETLGGIDVFVCRDGYFTVYVDCESRLPLKIQTKKTEIDVISVQVNRF